MRRVAVIAALLAAGLSPPANGAAQSLPPGGYYADGAYYVSSEAPGSTAAAAPAVRSPACPAGYGVPTLYVASTATMIRIQQVWPVGGDAPGFPYVPVQGSELRC